MSLNFLDYGKPNPFGEIIGRPRNLAWPVEAYRITLPEVSDNGDGLNPFERVILKIIDAAGVREADALASETCIPVDMVQCIILRLRDKKFIDDYNEIIEEKSDWWKKEKEPIYVTAVLFRELATGKILPFLHSLDNKNQLKKKEKDKKYFQIYKDDRYKNKEPTPEEVILALRTFKKRSANTGIYLHFPAAEQIRVTSKPELYYLDCPIAIQKSDGEFRIADPFGNGFSLLLERSFSCLLEQDDTQLMEWKQRLYNPKSNKQDDRPREPFDNDANLNRYRNLVLNLSLGKNTKNRSIEQIYSALEWALFYACIQRQYDIAISELKYTNQAEHSELLAEAAEELGFESLQKDFKPVSEGRLNDFQAGKAEMVTVLSIILLMAVKDRFHPLRRIAEEHQDLIRRLFEIKKKRDDQSHGKGKARKNEVELPDEVFMREIITALLPDIRFSDTPVVAKDKDSEADIELKSRGNIQAEFGFKHFNRLGTDMQNRLICAERFWLSCEDGDALLFVCDLYAVLQAMFWKSLTGALPPDVNDSDFIKDAKKKAAEANLGELPESLSTVRPLMIRKTLQGDNQTLGACVVAFLLVLDEDSLITVSDNQPRFLSDITDIIKRRGHGNEPLPMSKSEIKELRKSTYSTIKTLLEVYKW